jgi:hypothetical protein
VAAALLVELYLKPEWHQRRALIAYRVDLSKLVGFASEPEGAAYSHFTANQSINARTIRAATLHRLLVDSSFPLPDAPT